MMMNSNFGRMFVFTSAFLAMLAFSNCGKKGGGPTGPVTPPDTTDTTTVVDTTKPSNLEMIVSDTVTNDTALSVAASGNDIDSVRFGFNDSTSLSSWIPYTSSLVIDPRHYGNLQVGPNILFMQARHVGDNGELNNSPITSTSFIYKAPDITPPSDLSISIDKTHTNSKYVNLTVGATDADSMQFGLNGTDWSPWEAYDTSKANFDITDASIGGSSVNGTKTAIVRARDDAGNISRIASASADYNTVGPNISVSMPDTSDSYNVSIPVSGDTTVNYRVRGATDSSGVVQGDTLITRLNGGQNRFTFTSTDIYGNTTVENDTIDIVDADPGSALEYIMQVASDSGLSNPDTNTIVDYFDSTFNFFRDTVDLQYDGLRFIYGNLSADRKAGIDFTNSEAIKAGNSNYIANIHPGKEEDIEEQTRSAIEIFNGI